MLSTVFLIAMLSVQTSHAQDSPWPGVTINVLVENENVKVFEVTFKPGAVADWHSHPQYTAYALTDLKMQVEIENTETTVAELEEGQAIWSPAVKHRTSNVGKKSFTLIVTEIKEVPHKH